MIKGLNEIENEIASHVGKSAHDEWTNLQRTFSGVYKQNRKYLIKYLEEPSKNDKLAVELIQNVRSPIKKEVYTNELLRHLYNYLSSLSALIDQGMRLTKKYDKVQLRDYIKKVNIVISSNINYFFRDLRNYIQHYGVPPLGWQIRFHQKNNHECKYYLSKEKLLEWSKWNNKSKKFIHSQEEVNLLECVETHSKMIDQTFDTLLSLFMSLHEKDIEEVNRLILRRNGILSGKIKY